MKHGHHVTAVARSSERLGPLAGEPHVRVVEADLEQDADLSGALPGNDACVHAALIWGEPGTESRDFALQIRSWYG